MTDLAFSIFATDGAARHGHLTTAHGAIDTPAFMPVGTAGTVKAMHPEAVARTGAQIVLGNTYHLMLRPGDDTVERLGGLHRFMNWPGPILTDSGGFQVMSLSGLRKISEKKVTFQSHIDGSYHEMSPEDSIRIQHRLGSDITMVLDECTPFPIGEDAARASMELSMRWAERSKSAFRARDGHGLFGIVQGSVFEAMRLDSAMALTGIGFDGYAIGGLAVGESQPVMFEVLDYTVPALPGDRPRYLMGVGKPSDIVGAVQRGIDMFDCVLPTRSGRNGQVFTPGGAVNLKNARHTEDPRPLEEGCPCSACTGYSRAYLRHLTKAGEILGAMLATEHNLTYYQRLMTGLRDAIEKGRLVDFAAEFHARQAEGDIPAR